VYKAILKSVMADEKNEKDAGNIENHTVSGNGTWKKRLFFI